jgi:hypothetical protein
MVDFRKNGEMQMARTMANGIVNELSNYQSTILSKDSKRCCNPRAECYLDWLITAER